MVPVRSNLSHIFSPRELRAVSWKNKINLCLILQLKYLQLDGVAVDEDEDELDFYAQAHLPG